MRAVVPLKLRSRSRQNSSSRLLLSLGSCLIGSYQCLSKYPTASADQSKRRVCRRQQLQRSVYSGTSCCLNLSDTEFKHALKKLILQLDCFISARCCQSK